MIVVIVDVPTVTVGGIELTIVKSVILKTVVA